MAINGVTTGTNISVTTASYESYSLTAEVSKTVAADIKQSEDSAAAVFEKSEEKSTLQSVPADAEMVERLKADAEARTAQLRSLVEKLLLKQAGTFFNSEGLANLFRNLEVDEETQRQAQEDISEDGYWGVEQTSDRIVDFAKAMAGNNPETAKSMLEAIKKGFKQAEEAWGEDLPGISKDTIKATYDKMDEWIKSLGGESTDSQTTASRAAASATTGTVKVTASYSKATAAYATASSVSREK